MSTQKRSKHLQFKEIIQHYRTETEAERVLIKIMAEGVIEDLKTAHLSKTHKISRAKIQEFREYCRTWINEIKLKKQQIGKDI